MEPVILRTEGVTRIFRSGAGEVRALNNVSISVPQRSLTVLRGPSGSGKTTLLNILGGLDLPTSGRAFFQDMEITALSEGQRDRLRGKEMGFVFQSVALMPDMTALENVEYGLRIAGMFSSNNRKMAEKSLKEIGLGKRMRHAAYELSGGEQQRVAIVRGYAHNPKILFADEPTAELDTAMGIQVLNIFKRLISEQGLTIVMTTHDPNILELADRVYTLSDGGLVDGND
ncbi:MAG TPA: ABC transporter ATP-binding protein [Clostridiales bacterium]|jgi:putative ABC transport system ATP-binding protein|nr:ABC transporter ATP-binding protein [Clostridiales bacterium]